MDASRKVDLEELELIKRHSPSAAERQDADRLQHRIRQQHPEITRLRHLLINAARRGNSRDTKVLNERIRRVEQELGIASR